MNAGTFLGLILITIGVMIGFVLGGCSFTGLFYASKEWLVTVFIVAGIPILIGILLIDTD